MQTLKFEARLNVQSNVPSLVIAGRETQMLLMVMIRHCAKCINYKAFVEDRQLVLSFWLFLDFAHEGVCHEGTQWRSQSYTVHLFVQLSFKLKELILI